MQKNCEMYNKPDIVMIAKINSWAQASAEQHEQEVGIRYEKLWAS